MAFQPVKSDMLGNVKVCSYPALREMSLTRPENKRQAARLPRRLLDSPRPRAQRTEGQEAHRDRGARMASPVRPSPLPMAARTY